MISTTHARILGAATAGIVAAAGLAAALPATAGTSVPAVHYTFRKLDNSNDETFNQLLGINSRGVIAGYFGSGAQGHKNKGYELVRPYHQTDYRTENFPGSAQTQVTGLNNNGVTVGFFSHTNDANPANNANFGFYKAHGRFHQVNFPASSPASPPVDQLLGVNDSDIAVGFYNDSIGNAHGYKYNIRTHHFSTVSIAGAVSLSATGINNHGDVCGFFNTATGPVTGFLLTRGGHLYTFAESGTNLTTQAFGVNDRDEVVGAVTNNGTMATYGFTWTPGHGFRKVNDPAGIGSTVINGVNDAGDLVGFYTGTKGNVNGLLATP